jgi:hypothetical protein
MSLETSQIEGHSKEFYIRASSSRENELGTYATEERCIEVLDEIHAYINGEYGTKLAIKSIHESQMKEEIDEKLALELMDKLEFVYVMPEV